MQIFCKCKRFFANAQTKMLLFFDFFRILGMELQKVRFFNIWVNWSPYLESVGQFYCTNALVHVTQRVEPPKRTIVLMLF